MRQYTLLTGATGLVGSFLMRDLLSVGKPVAVLLRPGRRGSERVRQFLDWNESVLGQSTERPVVFEGDINCAQLGLASSQRRWIANHCHRVLHSAASLQFFSSDRDQNPWRTNLHGTGTLLDFCRSVGLKEFHFVSTAYVCGRRDGRMLEHELAVGQEFRNDYEWSKFLAEQLVRQCQWIDSPTIYRPVIVSGDSQTGYSQSFHGLHYYLKLLDLLTSLLPADSSGRRHVPLQIDSNAYAPQNVVPVDWVAKVICLLMDEPAARGLSFHLAPRVPLMSRQFFEQVYQVLDCTGLRFADVSNNALSPRPVRSRLERVLRSHTHLYRPYECADVVFDDANVRRFANHLPSPPIDSELLRRYLGYGRLTNWGKSTAPATANAESRHAA